MARGAVLVHVEGVEGRAVGPEGVGHAGGGVFPGDVRVLLLPRLPGRPVQQRQVQQAVDDEAVVLRRAHPPPGLDELPLGLVAADELAGGQDSGLPGLLIPGELIGRHAGGSV